MAASTRSLTVPELFDEIIDDDSSSSSEYCSITNDSHGMVDEFTFPFTKDIVMSLLSDLEYSDEVSLAFLLTEDVKNTFYKLLKPLRPGEVVAEWLMSQHDGCWENKLIEALCIIENYQMLGLLVKNVTNEKIRFAAQSPESSLFVNCTRKALYLMCEALCAKELDEMMQRVRRQCSGIKRTFPCEFMEINLMYWSCCRSISLGDAYGRGINMEILKKVLESMKKYQLLEFLKSMERALVLQRDGPDTVSTCSSKRLCIDPTSSPSVTLPSARPSSSPYYNIDPDNVGVCLIINQKIFYKEQNPRFQYHLLDPKLDDREGTDVDRDRLYEIFFSLGFTLYVRENLTHLQIISTLQEVINTKVTKKHSCFVLCILSHGAEGIVSGTNSVAVYKEELENCLKEAPILIGKPKLVILQVCQGEKFQNVVFCEEDVAIDGPSSTTTRRGIGESADILTFWSTVPGYASFRDPFRGTWFIQALWHQIMTSFTDEDITVIFTRVIDDVSSRCQYLDGSYKTMVPQQCSSLRKILKLRHDPRRRLDVSLLMYQRFHFEILVKQFSERRKRIALQRCLAHLNQSYLWNESIMPLM